MERDWGWGECAAVVAAAEKYRFDFVASARLTRAPCKKMKKKTLVVQFGLVRFSSNKLP